jgi:hypothetical protein
MTRIAVITKSYAPDFELCVALNRSVLDNSSDTVQHHIIVPRSELKLFDRLAGPRTHIRCEADFLPRTFLRAPFPTSWSTLAGRSPRCVAGSSNR